jgi:cation:H+ antiporter
MYSTGPISSIRVLHSGDGGDAVPYAQNGAFVHLLVGNAMQFTFFLLPDLLARIPVLPTASDQSLWLGAVGAVATAIFAYGLLVRTDRKVIGLGRDSVLVLLTYIAAVALLTAVPG